MHSSLIQSLLWVALCIAATAFTVFLILMQWDRYQTHRVSTAIGSIMYPLEKVPFPGVTLCSSNIIFGSMYKKFESMLINDGLSKAQILDYFANLSSLVLHEELEQTADWKTYGRIIQALDLSDYNTERLMNEVAQPCELLITNCFLSRKLMNCSNIFEKTKTQSGFCCSLVLKNDSISGVGPKYGLQIEVDVVEEEYISAIKPYYGLDVILHQKNAYPETKYLDTPVAMGVDVQIAVIPEVVRATDELRKMSVKLRECLFEDESTLRWDYIYSLSGCKSQCEADIIRKYCKCIPYYYPVEDNERICSLLDLRCLRNVLFNKFMEDSCNCLPPCEKVDYKYTVNAREVKTIIGYDESIQGSRITIYFGSDQCVMIERSANLTWDALLASIGGVIGLCLGGSVLSIIEFIYFFCKTIFCRYQNEVKKKQELSKLKVAWGPKFYFEDFKMRK